MATEIRTTRRYRKRRRAEQEEQTRQRITEAAVELHGTVGPARTTMSGIAERAGVQRATLYRHFPTEEAIFEACSGHFWSRHPLPDQTAWAAISDPQERLEVAITEMYRLYGETEWMLEKTSRDAPVVPSMAAPVQAFRAYLQSAAKVLLRGRPERGASRRRIAAAIGHALAFPTWQSLIRLEGLEQSEAVAMMAAMVEAAGAGRGLRPSTPTR
jgi:AcrR family transcriptional regulator